MPYPIVLSVSPGSGVATGGTGVFINGYNFTGTTSVTFGGAAAAFTVISDTIITATTPAGTVGVQTVVVVNASGSSNALSPAVDSSGNGNDGVYTAEPPGAIAFTDGLLPGDAAWLAGTSGPPPSPFASSYVHVPSSLLSGTAPWSLAFWYKLDPSLAGGGLTWYTEPDTAGVPLFCFFGLAQSAISSGQSMFEMSGFTAWIGPYGTDGWYCDGLRHHCALVNNGVALLLYLDGSLVPWRVDGGTPTNWASAGPYADTAIGRSAGVLDEYAVFASALSAGDVAALFAAETSFAAYSAAVLARSPVAYYHLDDGGQDASFTYTSAPVGSAGWYVGAVVLGTGTSPPPPPITSGPPVSIGTHDAARVMAFVDSDFGLYNVLGPSGVNSIGMYSVDPVTLAITDYGTFATPNNNVFTAVALSDTVAVLIGSATGGVGTGINLSVATRSGTSLSVGAANSPASLDALTSGIAINWNIRIDATHFAAGAFRGDASPWTGQYIHIFTISGTTITTASSSLLTPDSERLQIQGLLDSSHLVAYSNGLFGSSPPDNFFVHTFTIGGGISATAGPISPSGGPVSPSRVDFGAMRSGSPDWLLQWESGGVFYAQPVTWNGTNIVFGTAVGYTSLHGAFSGPPTCDGTPGGGRLPGMDNGGGAQGGGHFVLVGMPSTTPTEVFAITQSGIGALTIVGPTAFSTAALGAFDSNVTAHPGDVGVLATAVGSTAFYLQAVHAP